MTRVWRIFGGFELAIACSYVAHQARAHRGSLPSMAGFAAIRRIGVIPALKPRLSAFRSRRPPLVRRNAPPPASVYGGMRFPALGAVVVWGVMASGCTVTVDSHSEILREEKQFKVTGIPTLRLTTFDGGIEIRGWEKPHVAVEIEKRGANRQALEDLEVRIQQTGNVIELEVKPPRSESFRGIGLHRTAYARLIVSVPREANITARSGDGAIKVERVSGRLELRTSDGSIRASDVAGELSLDTSDGSITVDGAEGRLVVDTGDGSVNVSGKLAVVKLHTGDGSVVYRADPGSAMADNWEITTGDGTVSVYLPEGFGAELDAHTGDGAIRSEIDGIESRSRDSARRTLRGKIGDGGKLLRIRTGDGSIRLRTN